MTPQELHGFIQSDPSAKSFADNGNLIDCAARCNEISPVVSASVCVSYLGLMSPTTGVGPDVARRVVITVNAIAESDPLAVELQHQFRVNSQGVDLLELIPFMAAAAGQVSGGITADDVLKIEAKTKQQQVFTVAEISAAMDWARANQ